jgi:Cu(I)/Ag(I) efflux system periplasmic protein CusF
MKRKPLWMRVRTAVATLTAVLVCLPSLSQAQMCGADSHAPGAGGSAMRQTSSGADTSIFRMLEDVKETLIEVRPKDTIVWQVAGGGSHSVYFNGTYKEAAAFLDFMPQQGVDWRVNEATNKAMTAAAGAGTMLLKATVKDVKPEEIGKDGVVFVCGRHPADMIARFKLVAAPAGSQPRTLRIVATIADGSLRWVVAEGDAPVPAPSPGAGMSMCPCMQMMHGGMGGMMRGMRGGGSGGMGGMMGAGSGGMGGMSGMMGGGMGGMMRGAGGMEHPQSASPGQQMGGCGIQGASLDKAGGAPNRSCGLGQTRAGDPPALADETFANIDEQFRRQMPWTAPAQGNAPRGITATGTIRRVEPSTRLVNLAHGPIPAMNWPPMTMDFFVSANVDLARLGPGQDVEFTIMPRPDDRQSYMITEIRPKR